MNWVMDTFNWAFYSLMNVVMDFTDFLFQGVQQLIQPDTINTILNLSEVTTVLRALTSLGVGLIITVTIITALKNMSEFDGGLNASHFMKRVVGACLWLVMAGFLVTDVAIPVATNLTSAATQVLSQNGASEFGLGTKIASNFIANQTSESTKYQPIIEEQLKNDTFEPNIKCKDIEGICPSGKESSDRAFDLSPFAMGIIVLFGVGIMTLIIGVQVVMRLFEFVMLQLTAPLCASSWISDPNGTRARTWQKLLLGTTVGTSAQLLVLGIGVSVISNMNSFISTSGALYFWVFILVVFGVFVAVIASPTIINQLVDNNSSVLESLKDIKSATGTIATAKNAVSSAVKGVKGAGGAVVGVGGAMKNSVTKAGGVLNSAGKTVATGAKMGMNTTGVVGSKLNGADRSGGVNATMNATNASTQANSVNPTMSATNASTQANSVNPTMSATNANTQANSVNPTMSATNANTQANSVNPTMSATNANTQANSMHPTMNGTNASVQMNNNATTLNTGSGVQGVSGIAGQATSSSINSSNQNNISNQGGVVGVGMPKMPKNRASKK